MAIFDTDAILHVINSAKNTKVGFESVYTSTSHPGTNQVIKGWEWDKRTWSPEEELDSLSYISTQWDVSISGLSETYYQSGYGDNKDLLLLNISEMQLSGLNLWTPSIHRGYFYTYDQEHYLYGDSYLTEYFTVNNTISGMSYVDLTHAPNGNTPIFVRSYKFNQEKGRYDTNLNARKKVEFTTSGIEPEFKIDSNYSPPRVWLNNTYSTVVGQSATINSLEKLGISNGEANQEFRLAYSPIDTTQDVEIWSWSNPASGVQWTIVSGINDLTAGSNYEVYVDYDHGIIQFGDYDTTTTSGESGNIPLEGYSIGAYYTNSPSIEYEPVNSVIYHHAYESNLNPIESSTSNGFIQIDTSILDPASVLLTSTLPQVNPYYINLGNNVGTLKATVRDKSNNVIDGIEVTFEIVGYKVGGLAGVNTESTAVTNSVGIATTLFHAPTTINDIGVAVSNSEISYDSGDTVISVEGLDSPESVSGVFIYKIHETDLVLGMDETDLSTYYTDYLTEEDIISGVQATESFEQTYRTSNNLLKPTTYSTGDITSLGKKTILLTTQANGTMNPKTGLEDSTTFIPLLPDSFTNIGTSLLPSTELRYGLTLPGIGTSGTKGYFIVGDITTILQAYVMHPRTGSKIKSNQLELKVTIPNESNGTYYADTLNDITNGLLTKTTNVFDISDLSIINTSGVNELAEAYYDERLVSGVTPDETYVEWFRRTRAGDTVGLNELAISLSDTTLSGLNIIEAQTPSNNITIPLGFRVKSTGITVASILDQVTYIDPNDHLVSGLFIPEY